MGMRWQVTEDQDIKLSGLLGNVVFEMGLVSMDDYYLKLTKAEVEAVAGEMTDIVGHISMPKTTQEFMSAMRRPEVMDRVKLNFLTEWLETASDTDSIVFC